MEIIHSKYSEVKNAIIEVKKLTADFCTLKTSQINLADAFYQDYKIVELDWDFYLEKYLSKFKCDVSGLEYQKYFPELLPYNNAWQNLFFLIMSIFSKTYYQNKLKINEKARLEVGDLVLSAISKKFVKRQQIKLVLTNN